MIITKPREWSRITENLNRIGAKSVFLMGCGQCATVAHTGGEKELEETAARLESEGFEVTGWTVGEVACHLHGQKHEMRKQGESVRDADAVLVLACGAGVQTTADAIEKPVFPGLESLFLGTVVRNGVYEERCQTCGDCVLGETAGICPVTTCPKGLLNGPCGGMWNGMCEVLTDRQCTHVRIRERLVAQNRAGKGTLAPKDFSTALKPGGISIREKRDAR